MKKNNFSTIALYGILFFLISTFNSCNKEDSFSKVNIGTSQVTSVTGYTAICGGVFSSDGGSTVSVYGVCWNTSPNPTIVNDTTIAKSNSFAFSTLIKGLSPSTTYYVRAYAKINNVIIYGDEVIFTTKRAIIELTTTAVSYITTSSVTCGGNISNDGGAFVVSRGICWSTKSNPTIENSSTTEGALIGSFSSQLSGLTSNTIYHIRAWASNSLGTDYGNEVTFITYNSKIVDQDGNEYFTINIGSQEWMAENLRTTKYRNGDSILTTTPVNKDISSESTPKYQWAYNGNLGLVPKYGRLYTWYTLNDSRNIAPKGWHVATNEEWSILANFLVANGYNYDGSTINNMIAKSLAATTDWDSITSIGKVGYDLKKNNLSGFTAFPAGFRHLYGGFGDFGSCSYCWLSSEYDFNEYAHLTAVYYNSIGIEWSYTFKKNGLPVRCVKD